MEKKEKKSLWKMGLIGCVGLPVAVFMLVAIVAIATGSDGKSEVKVDPNLYSVISDQSMGDQKRTVEVKLKKPLSEHELGELAKALKSNGPGAKLTFVNFDLMTPPIKPWAHWATARFDPKMSVTIYYEPGETEDAEAK